MKRNYRREVRGCQGRHEEFERNDTQLEEAIQYAEAGDPQRALVMLEDFTVPSDVLRNVRGVCLLRLGRYKEALSLFRHLVLTPGCTWMKRETPVIYRTNFCTALFLSGHPAGCADCLVEIAERSHPSVIRLQQAIERWQKNLPWWPRLQWKLGLEPTAPMVLDFLPGDFLDTTGEPPRTTSGERRIARAA